MVFARFSRPQAKILFSRKTVIAPYRDGKAWMFRLANARRSQLLNVEVTVIMTTLKPTAPSGGRFHTLDLERSEIALFPAQRVVVRPITGGSPPAGLSRAEVDARQPEFLIVLTAIGETFSETVHTRASYCWEDIVWNAKFADTYFTTADGSTGVDFRRFHDVQRVRAAGES